MGIQDLRFPTWGAARSLLSRLLWGHFAFMSPDFCAKWVSADTSNKFGRSIRDNITSHRSGIPEHLSLNCSCCHSVPLPCSLWAPSGPHKTGLCDILQPQPRNATLSTLATIQIKASLVSYLISENYKCSLISFHFELLLSRLPWPSWLTFLHTNTRRDHLTALSNLHTKGHQCVLCILMWEIQSF